MKDEELWEETSMNCYKYANQHLNTDISVDKIINKMNLVKRDEFDVLKRMVQKLLIENENLKKNKKQPKSSKKKVNVRKKNKKK